MQSDASGLTDEVRYDCDLEDLSPDEVETLREDQVALSRAVVVLVVVFALGVAVGFWTCPQF